MSEIIPHPDPAVRRRIIDLIRLGLYPDPPPLDLSNMETAAETFMARYAYRPDLFAQEIAGIVLDEWQAEVLFDVAAGERQISIRSAHGTGKSMDLGLGAIWFMTTRFRCKVVMTAPTAGQLFDALLAETKSILKRCPEIIQKAFEIKSDRLELKAATQDVFLSARTSSKENPEALQGVHSDWVLLIVDEASGVPDAVFNAAGGSMSGVNVTMVMAGNPTRLLGRFARSHLQKGFREEFKRYHIGEHNSTRISPDYLKSVEAEFGRDSNEYRVRCQGEFPKTDRNSFISADLVMSAMEREIATPKHAKIMWAFDPARFGNDACAFGERRGPVIPWIESKKGLDTMAAAGWVKNKWDSTPADQRPFVIVIDVIGIGSGVYDRLREQNLPVRPVNVSETPILHSEKCMRLRDELWYRYKEWLATLAVKIPNQDDLLSDSISPRYSYSSDGRLKVESKEDMRKRGESSPDKADVCCMLMLEDDVAIFSTGISGSGLGGKALERGLQATC